MLLRSLQQSLPTLLHRSGAAFTTSTSLRGLEELIVLPPKEDAKPPTTGTRTAPGRPGLTENFTTAGGGGARRLRAEGPVNRLPHAPCAPVIAAPLLQGVAGRQRI